MTLGNVEIYLSYIYQIISKHYTWIEKLFLIYFNISNVAENEIEVNWQPILVVIESETK